MGRKRQPKYGQRSRYLLSLPLGEVYSPTDVKQLCARSKIDYEAHGDEMRGRLNGAANVYANYKANHDDAPSRTHIRAALLEVHRLSAALNVALGKIDDWTANVFWFKSSNGANPRASSPSPHFHIEHWGPPRISGLGSSFQSINDLQEGVGLLEAFSADAIKDVGKDIGGPRSNEAMRMWVINLRKLWVDVLKRRFTIDYHKGQGTTPAFDFCWAAIRLVDKSVRKDKLITAMRKVIREYAD